MNAIQHPIENLLVDCLVAADNGDGFDVVVPDVASVAVTEDSQVLGRELCEGFIDGADIFLVEDLNSPAELLDVGDFGAISQPVD